ncbi:MAG: stimulus-sensing domain-containing protein [Rhodospirillales bacterium]|jgi:two-component system sensor histidine kinase ChvG|nr:stimulus-sensing domain-containing protein [Rhodospirillales bacterium]MDP7651478.1 stimulus-sensing domain-containing protein [Rhodospirillales bacterium]HJO97111.1 stimulus-sensing domain-containing protein [Rhodospirillales bacterium]
MTRGVTIRRKRRALSPITRRILAVNVLALAILVAGLLYLGTYRRNLIDAELTALDIQAEMFAGALGEGAVGLATAPRQRLDTGISRQMVRRLALATGTRARLFDDGGTLLADSRRLTGPGGAVQIEELPPPDDKKGPMSTVLKLYDRLVNGWLGNETLEPYREKAVQRAGDYAEAARSLAGEDARSVRAGGHTGIILIVAVPVQRYKQVLGALMLSKDGRDINAALADVRLGILKAFGVALGVTVLLSIYLASTIANPIHHLVLAAERVRSGRGRQTEIPDLAKRRDEVGELAAALSDMTDALWQRMDAIERFAADVAHEIKNPLTSLSSAVQTATRIDNPEQQRRLMTIIQEDVQRLDRLISDIADASRLDTELSHDEAETVDLAPMLTAMAEVHRATRKGPGPEFRLEIPEGTALLVNGVEDRLVQVFRNLLANAFSFSSRDGIVTLRAALYNGWIEIQIDDDGPGLPDGKEEAIFERFYSDRPESEKFGRHSGLGLSISKQIVEAHGGTLDAANRRRAGGDVAGARFTARLPALGFRGNRG